MFSSMPSRSFEKIVSAGGRRCAPHISMVTALFAALIPAISLLPKSTYAPVPGMPPDKVVTKVQGAEVEATVTKLWQNELQVRTPDN